MIDGPRVAAKSGQTKSLVIFLHGYGADGNDLIGLAEPLAGILLDTAFASPHAPEPCAMAPMGRQWFPIPRMDGSTEEARAASLARSAPLLDDFITAEAGRAGVGMDKVALVGFSQGTMMSLHVGLRREETLAGIVGFSGMLLSPETLDAEIVTRPPVVLVHGDADPVVPVAALHEARTALAGAGVAVQWSVRPGLEHGIDPDGLRMAAMFLHERLS